MARRKSLRPSGWKWAENLSHDLGVQVDDMIWVSGMIAFDPDGNLVGEGDVRVQADKVFSNIAEILAVGGATLNDVVKITAWLTDFSNYSGYNEARTAAFPDRLPASATVHSPQLVFPGLLVEIEAVAVVNSD
ncbi:MAG: RidA family protein [Fuerstiella sp.]|nr:RidA family protein [Fuerstiella sp.]